MSRKLKTIRDYVRWGASRLNAADAHFGHGTDNALDEAAVLVLHALHLPPDLPADYGDCRLTGEERKAVEELLLRRVETRMPAAYLTGEAWFAGLRFEVDQRVLIPRSPIGELIGNGFDSWLADRPAPRILDLCTGSGCIAVATAVHLPASSVDAADLSSGALEVARQNVEAHGVEDRVELRRSDLFSNLEGRVYDLIVSNPPYVGHAEIHGLPDEYRHEPELALASGSDGLDLPLRILRDAADHLRPEGTLIMEVGNAAEDLQQILPETPFLWLEFEHGGHGVLALDQSELMAIRATVEPLLQEREAG